MMNTEWSHNNLAWIVACQISCGEEPKVWQLMVGYRVLIKSTLRRWKFGLSVTSHLEEYRQAREILIFKGK